MASVCHLLRQSANVFSCPGMCTALSMMLLTANVSHNSRKQACKKTCLLRIEFIISTHAWLSQWIIMHLPFNFNCHSLTATTTVRSSNCVMDNCCWVIIGGKSSWKYSPSQMAPHPVRLASVENNCSLDYTNSVPITETTVSPVWAHMTQE